VTEEDRASAAAFAEQGEIDFKAGNYHAAAKDWQHSLVDDPKNGAVMMLLAQALFAEGKYEQAAGATQAAMQMLPEDKWGVVIANYAELYGNVQDYTDQVRALEAARKANPDSPALRFLLGFHFGYLNYPKQAVTELDEALSLAPRDLGSRKVREIFAARWPEAPPLPKAVLDAESGQPAASGPALPTPSAPGPSDATADDKVARPPGNR
jgi:tetratricopeptide (TPR) repeat protein